MKSHLSCLTLLLIGFASSNLYAQYDAYAPFEKGEVRKDKIKMITEVGYTSCNVDDKNSWQLTNSKESRGYDSRGNMTSHSQYNKLNRISVIQGWGYDDRDNVVEHTNAFEGYTIHTEHKYTLNDKGKVVEDITNGGPQTFKYGATGNLVESAKFNWDGRPREKKTYNANGDITESLSYDNSGQPDRTIYTYDGAGHRTKEEQYGSSGNLWSRIVDTYDGAGNRTKEEKYVLGGRLYSITVDTYDGARHRTKEEKYDASGHLSSLTGYRYDEAGNSIKEEDYDSINSKTLIGWWTLKRGPKGLVTERDHFNPKGECTFLVSYTYEFYP